MRYTIVPSSRDGFFNVYDIQRDEHCVDDLLRSTARFIAKQLNTGKWTRDNGAFDWVPHE